MPVLLARLDPYFVACADPLHIPAPTTDPPDPVGDEQHLPQRMGVPGGTRPDWNVTVAPLRLPLPQKGQAISTLPVK